MSEISRDVMYAEQNRYGAQISRKGLVTFKILRLYQQMSMLESRQNLPTLKKHYGTCYLVDYVQRPAPRN